MRIVESFGGADLDTALHKADWLATRAPTICGWRSLKCGAHEAVSAIWLAWGDELIELRIGAFNVLYVYIPHAFGTLKGVIFFFYYLWHSRSACIIAFGRGFLYALV